METRKGIAVIIGLSLSGLAPVHGQVRRVETWNLYERVIAVVPLTGAGTWQDPRRPQFVPRAGEDNGIVEYRYVLTDDGLSAVVEFAARSRKALEPILNSGGAAVVVTEKGTSSKEQVEQEAKRYRSDFDLEKFQQGRMEIVKKTTAEAAR